MVHPLWKTVWRFLKQLKIELTYDPAISPLYIYIKKTKTLIQKDTCTPVHGRHGSNPSAQQTNG